MDFNKAGDEMAVVSTALYMKHSTLCSTVQTDNHANTSSLKFYRLDVE